MFMCVYVKFSVICYFSDIIDEKKSISLPKYNPINIKIGYFAAMNLLL